jgi:hypothetical protein
VSDNGEIAIAEISSKILGDESVMQAEIATPRIYPQFG